MPRGTPTPVETRQRILRLARDGHTGKEISRRTKVGYRTVREILNGDPAGGPGYRAQRQARNVPSPLRPEQLCPEARRGLEDFNFWRLRYTGHISTPWQSEAAEEIIDKFATPYREYLVVNVFPGSGKSTLFTDLAAWRICRDRATRGLFGSRSSGLARRNTRRVRRLLERPSPIKASPEDIEAGLAVDAAAAPSVEYGLFKPTNQDVWKADEFVVEQLEAGVPIEEKESTLTAFGFDQEYLGSRFDWAFWDDIDSLRNMSLEVVEKNREIFDRETEPRVEPGGLMVVCQQRLGPFDFSAYCLSKMIETDDGPVSRYQRIRYRAHYETECEGAHALDAPPWPAGCLLEPRRLPWKDILGLVESPQWATVYQQEEQDEAGVLVPKLWITGGRDPETGVTYPGCWDRDRDLCAVPEGLTGDLVSVASCDPSPTRNWGLIWEAWHPETETRFVLDIKRGRMSAPDFLSWNNDRREFEGIAEVWQARSKAVGLPIGVWILEVNAAQRWLLELEHVARWQRKWGVEILPHQTTVVKRDPALGVQGLGPLYRHGQIRLPGKQGTLARPTSLKLVEEVTRWPAEGQTDDLVMAQWFIEHNLEKLRPHRGDFAHAWRPSWIRRHAEPVPA